MVDGGLNEFLVIYTAVTVQVTAIHDGLVAVFVTILCGVLKQFK